MTSTIACDRSPGTRSHAKLLRSVLAQQTSGFIKSLNTCWTDADEPSLAIATATIGGTGQVFNGQQGRCAVKLGSRLHGSGVGVSIEDAVTPALAEAMERYATANFYEEQSIWSTAYSLNERMLDLATVPQCSETERANPHCSLCLPSKSETIRWVKGLSLHDCEPTLVPTIMVYSNAGWRVPQERFWLPISTGCAAHRSYEEAVIKAICEVVERDAISLVWLQQLALPRIVVESPGPVAAPFWDAYQRSSADIEYHFFDATTDVGLPTIYGVQVSQHHRFARTTVACATALSFDEAIAKVLKDFAAIKPAFVSARSLPIDTFAFTNLLDGASYTARPENAHAFEFLLRSRVSVPLSQLSAAEPKLRTLSDVLCRLVSLGMQAIAVDLTPDEAFRVGLRVVRVLIPELHPFSIHRAVQYRAHPRLYTAPASMGYTVHTEKELNWWPQPFA